MSRIAVLFIFASCVAGLVFFFFCTDSKNRNVVSVAKNADEKSLLKQVNNTTTAVTNAIPLLDDPTKDPVMEDAKPKVTRPLVVYAARDIKKGEVIVLDSLVHRELEPSKVPADAIKSGSIAVGSKAKEEIHKGQIVRYFELESP